MSWVFDHSRAELGARLVLLAIANHADAHGRNAFPSQKLIAEESAVSVRSVKRCVASLADLGELTVGVHEGKVIGQGRTNYYELPRFLASQQGANMSPGEQGDILDNKGTSSTEQGAKSGNKGPTVAPHEPSLRTVHEPSVEPPARSLAHRSPTFADCWKVYPRKLARKQAEKAWIARIKAGTDPQALYDATVHYAQHRTGDGDDRFTLHGSTFYGPDERWTDFLDPSSARPPKERRTERQKADDRLLAELARTDNGQRAVSA